MDNLYGDIPFEASTAPRSCGAACLAMVYRALGRVVPQAEIWARVARRNEFGSVASITHLMARDALAQGFAAVAVQARNPLQALRACSDADAHAILSLRLTEQGREGHYSVLLDIDRDYVTLHDPTAGPRRMLRHADLLALWQPGGGPSEATGHVLIGIAPLRDEAAACLRCRTPIPESIACPRCRAQVRLRPSAPIGCMAAACPERLWARLCCPECDLLWDIGVEAKAAAAAVPALDLGRMSAALDAFCAATTAIPGVAANPDVVRLLGLLSGTRTKLELALAEDAAGRAKLAAMQQEAAAAVQAKVQAIRASMPPAAPPPLLTLDAAALGRALLERLDA